MDDHSFGRRKFMKKMTALGTVGIAGAAGLAPGAARAAYDPRRNSSSR